MDEDEVKELEQKNENEKEEKLEKPPVEGKEEKKETTSVDVEAYKKAIADTEIERIRQEEKTKLYPSLEKYKEDARKADEARKVAEDKLKEYETSKLSAEEQATLRLQQLEESNTLLTERMQELVEEANNKISTLQLELYKKELLGKYGDEIIPAMVQGTTIEEITESAENAHREYISIREREIAKMKESTDKSKTQVGTGIKPQNDKLNVGTTVADIRKISDKDTWEKNRGKFLEEAIKH